MRSIGEQWIENGRMYKAVEGPKIVNGLMEGNTCHGCCYVDKWDDDCLNPNQACPVGKGVIIKDLGPVNDMGMLRIPFEVPEGYPLYPTIKSYSTSIEAKDSLFQVVYSNVRLHMAYGFFNSEQEAIDAWNRRA